MLCKMLFAYGTRRHNGLLAERRFLLFYDGKAAIYFLFLCFYGGGCGKQGCGRKKTPAGIVYLCIGYLQAVGRLSMQLTQRL